MKKYYIPLVLLVFVSLNTFAFAGTVDSNKITTFSSGTIISSSDVNTAVGEVVNQINDNDSRVTSNTSQVETLQNRILLLEKLFHTEAINIAGTWNELFTCVDSSGVEHKLNAFTLIFSENVNVANTYTLTIKEYGETDANCTAPVVTGTGTGDVAVTSSTGSIIDSVTFTELLSNANFDGFLSVKITGLNEFIYTDVDETVTFTRE